MRQARFFSSSKQKKKEMDWGKPLMEEHRKITVAEDQENGGKKILKTPSVAKDQQDDKRKELKKALADAHSDALDDLVSVNSLFTIAVFIGLSFASPDQHSLENRPECDADPVVAKTLVMYEVISFALFLVSSLAAKSLKVLLNFYKIKKDITLHKIPDEPIKSYLLSHGWRKTVFIIATGASACGLTFLTLSMVNVIQIRLGMLSCGSVYTLKSVISLTVLVFSSILLLYGPPIIFAAFAKLKDSEKTEG